MDISNIEKVYNGKIGCMCGCKGKYSYNEGVEHYDWQGDTNVRSIKIMAKKILTNPKVVYERGMAIVEDFKNDKMQVIYFKEAA